MTEFVNIIINRPAYTNNDLAKAHHLEWSEEPSVKDKLKKQVTESFACTRQAWKKRVLGFLPFISILQNYQWKNWLLFDMMSGLSVGVIQIPQGMGFALLTSVPPVFGLYSSLFPVLLYFFFGTSRHISMGTMALISLMIGTVVDRESDRLLLLRMGDNATSAENGTFSQEQIDAMHVDFAMSMSLLVGCFQIIMAMLNLSKITIFMSKSFMGGYLNGAAVHIIGSQVLGLFGLKVKNPPGIFRVPRIVYIVAAHITETNICAIVTGLICITILFVLKEIINIRFKSRMKVPIPAELIILVLGCLVSHYNQLHERYDLRIIGNIPQGIPEPRIPSMTNAPAYIVDAIVTAVVSFAISVSMVNLMAEKHKYHVDANQEMLAYGICHTISSMLNSFAGCQAPPRTLVHEAVGGQTQLGSLVSCILVFLVCMLVGPYINALPITVLASVIIVALLPLFKQFRDLPRLWRISKCDFFTWVVTFVTIVVFDISIGLVVGIFVNMFMVLLQSYFVAGFNLINVRHTNVYISDHNLLPEEMTLSEPVGVKIFSFKAPLFYLNVANFKSQLFAKTVSCDSILQSKIHTIIIDCSTMSYIDLMGIELLKTLHKEYQLINIELVLADVPPSIVIKLRLCGAVSGSQLIGGQLQETSCEQSDSNMYVIDTPCSNSAALHVQVDTIGPPPKYTENAETEKDVRVVDQFSSGRIAGASTSSVKIHKTDTCTEGINIFPTVHDAVVMAEAKDEEMFEVRL